MFSTVWIVIVPEFVTLPPHWLSMKPALVIVLLLVIRPLFTVTPLFITGPLLVKTPDVEIAPLLTKFSVLVNTPWKLSSDPKRFMVMVPDEVMTPVLEILPSVVIVPVGPLVIVPVEVMLPKLLNGPLFVIVPRLAMKPLLVTVPEVVITPPAFAIKIVPLFWITPLLVIVPMVRVTCLAIPNVSVGPITRVPTLHVMLACVQTPPTDGDSHDGLSCTVEVTAIAFVAEKTSTEIMATSTGSTIAFFMYVIISLTACKAIKPRLHLS
jgi:hypothetical protein